MALNELVLNGSPMSTPAPQTAPGGWWPAQAFEHFGSSLGALPARVLDGLRRNTPPGTAPELPGISSPWSWYAPSAQPHGALSVENVTTTSGHGYGLVDGRVYSWNTALQQWERTDTRGIRHLKLGADDKVYALDSDHRVVQLDAQGRPTERAVPLSAGTQDFAVSPGGSVVSVRSGEQGTELALLDGADLAAGGPSGAHERVLQPTTAESDSPGALRSVTFDKEGKLWVLGQDGRLWQGERSAGTWRWSAMPGATMEGLGGDANRVTRLTTHADGVVAGEDLHGNTLLIDRDGSWTPVHADVPTQAGNFGRHLYGQFGPDPKALNVMGIAAPFPIHARNPMVDKPWYMWRSRYPDFEGQDVNQRNLRYWQGHQPFQLTRGTNAGAVTELRNELQDNWSRLDPHALSQGPVAQIAERSHVAAINEQLVPAVDANTHRVLDDLELRLGLRNPDGTPNPDPAKSAAFRAVQAPSSLVNSDRNAIRRLVDTRTALALYDNIGGPDFRATTQRLTDLLDKGVYLPLDSKHHVQAGSEFDHTPALGHYHNKYGVLTGKLAGDHAVLVDATRAARGSDAPGDVSERVRALNHNRISTLHDANFKNLDRAYQFLRTYDFNVAGLTDQKHKLHRALTAQGIVQGDPVEAYVRVLNSMKPGDSITFGAKTSAGADGDGQAHVFDTSDRDGSGKSLGGTLNIKMNLVPGVQPTPTAGAGRTHDLTLTKTHDGMRMSFGKTTDWELKPLSVKLMWGFGAVGSTPKFLPVKLTGVGFIGAEAIPEIGVAGKQENSASFHFTQDDEGKLQRVLRGVLGGTMSPYELIAESDQADNTRSTTLEAKAALNTHALAAVVGIAGAPDSGHSAKLVSAGLAQIYGNAAYQHGKSTTVGADGGSERIVDGWNGKVGVRAIAINEAQYQQETPTHYGSYQKQDKVPLFIAVVQKDLWGRQLSSDGYTMTLDQGKIAGVGMELRTTSAPIHKVLARTEAFKDSAHSFTPRNIPQLEPLLQSNPELAPHLAKLRDAQAPVTTRLELTPEALDQLHDHVARGGAYDEAALKRHIQGLLGKPQNLRITDISTSTSDGYDTSAATGYSLLRYASGAQNIYRRDAGRIAVDYSRSDRGDAKPAVHVSGELLLGDDAGPNFDQLRRMVSEGGPRQLERVLDPVGGDPVRGRLAQMPSGAPIDTEIAASRELVSAWGLPPPQGGPALSAVARGKQRDDVDPGVVGHASGSGGVASQAAGIVGLINGRLVVRTPDADGSGWDTIALPADPASRIVDAGGRPLLLAMDRGDSGRLDPTSLSLTPAEHRLLALVADNRRAAGLLGGDGIEQFTPWTDADRELFERRPISVMPDPSFFETYETDPVFAHPLAESGDYSPRGVLVLEQGQLEYRRPAADGASWQKTLVPADLLQRLADGIGEPLSTLRDLAVDGHLHDSQRLLSEADYRRLDALAAAPPPTARRSDALHINAILDALHEGRIAGPEHLSPAQQHVVREFFRAPDGELDLPALRQVLDDSVQMDRFKDGVASYRPPAAPPIAGNGAQAEGVRSPLPSDPYDLLGVPRNASRAEIDKAFRHRAPEFHPDRHPNDPQAAENFRRLGNARDQLTSPGAADSGRLALPSSDTGPGIGDRIGRVASWANAASMPLFTLQAVTGVARLNARLSNPNLGDAERAELTKLRDIAYAGLGLNGVGATGTVLGSELGIKAIEKGLSSVTSNAADIAGKIIKGLKAVPFVVGPVQMGFNIDSAIRNFGLADGELNPIDRKDYQINGGMDIAHTVLNGVEMVPGPVGWIATGVDLLLSLGQSITNAVHGVDAMERYGVDMGGPLDSDRWSTGWNLFVGKDAPDHLQKEFVANQAQVFGDMRMVHDGADYHRSLDPGKGASVLMPRPDFEAFKNAKGEFDVRLEDPGRRFVDARDGISNDGLDGLALSDEIIAKRLGEGITDEDIQAYRREAGEAADAKENKLDADLLDQDTRDLLIDDDAESFFFEGDGATGPIHYLPHQGEEEIWGHEQRPNVFLLGDGYKQMIGGSADDSFIYVSEGTEGRDDFLDGKTGRDLLSLASLTGDGYSIDLSNDELRRDDQLLAEIPNIEDVVGSRGEDTITGDESDNYIDPYGGGGESFGLDGDDTMTVRWDERPHGGAGDNTLVLEYEHDDLQIGGKYFGGRNVDLRSGTVETQFGYPVAEVHDFNNVVGTDSDDRITGNDDANYLSGGDGHNKLYGQDGSDVLIGGGQEDKAYGDDGRDLLVQGSSNWQDWSSHFAPPGSDEGGDAAQDPQGATPPDPADNNGSNVLHGGNDDDAIYTGDSNDALLGGKDDDTLIAGGNPVTTISDSGAPGEADQVTIDGAYIVASRVGDGLSIVDLATQESVLLPGYYAPDGKRPPITVNGTLRDYSDLAENPGPDSAQGQTFSETGVLLDGQQDNDTYGVQISAPPPLSPDAAGALSWGAENNVPVLASPDLDLSAYDVVQPEPQPVPPPPPPAPAPPVQGGGFAAAAAAAPGFVSPEPGVLMSEDFDASAFDF